MADFNTTPDSPLETQAATQPFDPEAAQADPWLGRMAGNYHILARIGQGTSGTVYSARDVRLERMVALKVLRFPGEAPAREALLREARLIARLGAHPGVVQIFGWGELDGNAYLALEWMAGSALSLLQARPEGLDPAQVIALALPCAEALAEAHAQGIIHGDIKPANLLIAGPDGPGKLCDFGLARLTRASTDPMRASGGSPAYMAPELLQGGPAGSHTDLFAFGVTLYQLLTGALPFPGKGSAEVTQAILENRREPLAGEGAKLDPRLLRIVEQCLEPDPARRPAGARALAGALRACGEQPTPVTLRPARHKAFLPFAAAAVAIVLGALVYPVIETAFHRDGTNVAQAEARDLLERGDYRAAAEAFEAALAGGAADDRVRYGLGYALLLDGQLERAEGIFAEMEDPVRAAEGQAAVAQARNDGDAARELTEAAQQDASGYAAVLLATADLSAGRWKEARDRLSPLGDGDLDFNWQRARLWQSLGMAHFRLGEVAEARAAFARAAGNSANARNVEMAQGYLEITERELARADREDLSAQIARLRDLRDSAPEVQSADRWTSRPLRVWIPPVNGGNSAIATESGLADVLPWRLSTVLFEQSGRPVDVVDRSITASLLSEQELSAQLSAPEDTVRLGGFLGARVAVLCRADTVFGEEALSVSLVDVETSRRIPVGEFPLNRATTLTTLTEEIGRAIVTALEKAYPLRGQVRQTAEGLRINLGTDMGVKPGMTIRLMRGPGTEFTLPGITATVVDPVGATSAGVILAPVDTVVPAEGWYAEVSPPVDTANG